MQFFALMKTLQLDLGTVVHCDEHCLDVPFTTLHSTYIRFKAE